MVKNLYLYDARYNSNRYNRDLELDDIDHNLNFEENESDEVPNDVRDDASTIQSIESDGEYNDSSYSEENN